MDHLASLRNEIDRLDESLIEILAQRFRITHEIGKLKKTTNLPPVDAQREERQAQMIKDLATKLGLREAVALKVLRVIIDEVVNDHKKI
jgi:chorismate mutase